MGGASTSVSPATIKALFGTRARDFMVSSMSARCLIGAAIGSMPAVGAIALNVWYHLGEDAFAVDIMKATCLTLGTASLTICSHLPIRENSRLLKPVMLPVGRATL